MEGSGLTQIQVNYPRMQYNTNNCVYHSNGKCVTPLPLLLYYSPAVATGRVVDQGVVPRLYDGVEGGLVLPHMYDGAVIKFTEAEGKKGRNEEKKTRTSRSRVRYWKCGTCGAHTPHTHTHTY